MQKRHFIEKSVLKSHIPQNVRHLYAFFVRYSSSHRATQGPIISAQTDNHVIPAPTRVSRSTTSIKPLIGSIFALKNRNDTAALQAAIDAFVTFLENDITSVGTGALRREIGNLVTLHNWVMRYSLFLLVGLQHIMASNKSRIHRKAFPDSHDEHQAMSNAHLVELEKFPPSLVISLLRYVLFLKQMRSIARELKKSHGLGMQSPPAEENLAFLARSFDVSLGRKLFFLLRARIDKIIPHLSLYEGSSIVTYWVKLQHNDTRFVKRFVKHVVKKLWSLSDKHQFLGPHEVAQKMQSGVALQIVLAMAKTRIPNTRHTHELAHALVPLVIMKDVNQLSVTDIVTLLSTFAKYELRNEYTALIHRFCVLIQEGRVATNQIVNAITSVVKIPETPADVIVFLYHSLIQQWSEASEKENEPQPSFRPLVNLIDTDFSWWGNVFEKVMTEMRKHWKQKIAETVDGARGMDSLCQESSPTADVRRILQSSIAVLDGLAHRETPVPPHPFTDDLVRLSFTRMNELSEKELSKFLHAASALQLPESITAHGLDWGQALPVLLKRVHTMDTRGVAHAVFIIGTQCPTGLTEANKNHLFMKWTAANACFSSKTLAMSVYGLGAIQPTLNEMQKKALTSLCEKRLIRHFDSKDIVLLCTGLQGLGISMEEFPDPFLHCMRRAIQQCASMEIEYIPRILSTFAQCGLVNTKLNVYTMRRITKEKETIDFDVFLESIEALLWVLGTDRVLYGDDFVGIHKFTRETILNSIHKATPERCVRMMNTCAILMPYDTNVIRTVAFAMNNMAAEMVQYVPSSAEAKAMTQSSTGPKRFLTAAAMLCVLPYACSTATYESSLLVGLRASLNDLQPTELQHLLYMCIAPMCDASDPNRAATYADLYETTRWLVIDSLLEDQAKLSKKSHAVRKVLPESIASLLLSMCDNHFCDHYFLSVFLRLGKRAVKHMNVDMVVLCASCLSELGLLGTDEFRFFARALRTQAEIKAEEFNSTNICGLLHVLWGNGVRTSSRLASFLGERAIEMKCE